MNKKKQDAVQTLRSKETNLAAKGVSKREAEEQAWKEAHATK